MCIAVLNLMSSPHCEVNPHEMKGKSPKKGGKSDNIERGEHGKA